MTRRLLSVLPATILVAVQFMLAPGLAILIGNRVEFEYGPGAVLPTLIGLALVVVAILTAIGAVLPDTARSRYTALLFGLGVLGWVQAAFLGGGYGQLTGAPIDWSLFTMRGWLDLAFWFIALAACCRYHAALGRRTGFLAPLLTVVILAAVIVTGMTTTDESASGDTVDPASLAKFSRTRNVLHILLDGFQTGTFLEVVEDEGLADDLAGFTVFTENAGVAAYTAMSVPAIFSGRIYDGRETPAEYHHRKLREGGFHHRLHDVGFAVHLIPKVPMVGEGYTMYAETPHTYGLDRASGVRQQALFMLDLGMFRSSPHFLRRVIYNGGNWRLGRLGRETKKGLNTHQRAFFAAFTDRLEVVYDQPAYHFIHLMPPHDPFVTLPDGTDAGRILETNHENYRTEARETLTLFLELLQRLRDEGIYDDTLIVLHADHGMGEFGKRPGDTRKLKLPRSAALLAVKPLGGSGPLAYSNAPTCVADIPATILDGLGLDHGFPGTSVFALGEEEPRSRIFNQYTLGTKSRGVITRYRLDGSLYDPAAWRELGEKSVPLGRPTYAWGDVIEFGVGHDSDRYLGKDWSAGGAAGCRANTWKTATITLQVPPTPGEVEARFTFRPVHSEGETRRLALKLKSQGKVVGEDEFRGGETETFTFTLPSGSAARGRVPLEFEFIDLDGGRRGAVQAFCLVSMVFDPVPES